MYLTSFVIILINYCIYYTLCAFFKNKRVPFDLLILITALLLVSVVGMHIIRSKNNTGRTSFEASLITTNIPSGTSNEAKEQVAFDAVNSIHNKDSVIVLPENVNVLPPYLENKDKLTAPIYGDHLIIGSFSGKVVTMFFLDPKTRDVRYTGKKILMPVGEYDISWVTFLLQRTQSTDWLTNYEEHLHTSDKRPPFIFRDTLRDNLLLTGSICAENISPYIFRDATKLGATVLFNLASHAPFRGSPLLLRQTMAISATRALENGRYYFTASNMTKSFVITDEGNIQDVSNSKETFSHFDTRIQTKDYMTPYTLYGDYMVIVCLILFVLAFLWL